MGDSIFRMNHHRSHRAPAVWRAGPRYFRGLQSFWQSLDVQRRRTGDGSQCVYNVVDLGLTNDAISINNKGELVGSTHSAGGIKTNVGLYWTNSSSPFVILSQPGVSTWTSANHITIHSQIVGELDTSHCPGKDSIGPIAPARC